MNVQQPADVEQTRRRWLEDERRVREVPRTAGTATPDVIASRSGLEFLKAILSGELHYPPIADTLSFTLVQVEEGKAIVQGTPTFAHYNPIGSVHGGWYCTLLDTALGCAVQSVQPKGRGYTTLELKVNLIRPLTDRTGPVRAEGIVVHSGRQTAIAEARLVDAAGKLYATATTTCLIFELSAPRRTAS